MKQLFQKIKVWYITRFIRIPAKECLCNSRRNLNKMDWAGREVTFSQEFSLRSNGLK